MVRALCRRPSVLDGPEVMLVEATVFAAYRLPVQHGSDSPGFLFVHELHPAVLVLHPLVATHLPSAARDRRILRREVDAANFGELLQQVSNLSSWSRGARARKQTGKQVRLRHLDGLHVGRNAAEIDNAAPFLLL